MSFLKFASSITGANYARLVNSTDKSKVKVIALALGVMIPFTLWMVTSFLLAHTILKNGWIISIAIAGILGFLVLTIERLIVMGNGHWITSTFRVFLAVVVAWLGAQLFDLVLFKDDIEHQLPQLKHQEAMKAQQMVEQEFSERNHLPATDSIVNANYLEFQSRQSETMGEAGGLTGSGIKGAGSATKFKQTVANTAKAQYEKNKTILDTLHAQSAVLQAAAYDSPAKSFNYNSLLYQIKGMKLMIKENSEMSNMYLCITCFFFLIEFLVLIFKLTWPKSAYEEESDMLEKLHVQRSDRMKGAVQSMYQPHLMNTDLARKSLSLGGGLNTLL